MSLLDLFKNFPWNPQKKKPSTFPLLKIGSQDKYYIDLVHKQLISSGTPPKNLSDDIASGSFGKQTKDAIAYFQQTHLGPDKENLSVDGIVGPDSWWSLYNDHGESQKLGLTEVAQKTNVNLIPMEISENRRKVLEIAVQEYLKGVKEIPDGSNYGDGVTKYLQFMGLGPTYWCACFTSWVVYAALKKLPWLKKIALVSGLYNHCKTLLMSKSIGSGYKPQPGDFFIIVHKNSSGHIGIILRVSADYKTMNVLEGNSGNRVSLRLRTVGKDDHVGYINYFSKEDNNDSFEKGVIKNVNSTNLDQTR